MATVVFAILATAFATTLSGALRSFQVSRARTLAEETATAEIEDARRLAYDDLGIVGGNPPGLVVPTQTVNVGGYSLTVVTAVAYVNDPLPGGFETGANYKKVQVTVTSSSTARTLAKMETLVAPPVQPSLNKGLMKVQVVDYALNQPVPGATVNLGTGPSAPRSDTTDASGKVSFAAVDPTPSSGATSTYQLTVAAAGYQVLPEDLSPAPAAKTTISAGQIFTTTLRVFKPVTLNVRLLTSTGTPYTGAATVTVSSARGSQAYAVTGGTLAVTQVASQPVIPSVQYSVAASATGGVYSTTASVVPTTGYPSVLTSDVPITMKAPVATGPLQVRLRDSANKAIAGATVVVTGGPGGILVTGVTDSSGNVSFTVPGGATPLYTVVVPPQLGKGQASGTIAVPAGSTTATLTLTVV